MDSLPEISNTAIIATMCMVLLMGGFWIALRIVFKLAMRVFVLGCAGILFLGGLIFLVSNYVTLP